MFTSSYGRMARLWMGLALVVALGLSVAPQAWAMGGKVEKEQTVPQLLEQTPASGITLAELGSLFWPGSNATEVQREEALKNILGKKVTWEIVVAEVQRQDGIYLVQGQSSQQMIGTFAYVVPGSKEDEQKLIATGRDGKLTVTGIAAEMQMRHIVLKPAMLATSQK